MRGAEPPIAVASPAQLLPHELRRHPTRIAAVSLRRLAYTSQATHPFSRRELLDLLHDARGFNAVDGITGLLIHSHGRFLQVLEGEAASLDDLLDRLRRDPRHNQPEVILDEMVDQRVFEGWAMGSADLTDTDLSLLPGVRNDLDDPAVVRDLLARLPELREALAAALD